MHHYASRSVAFSSHVTCVATHRVHMSRSIIARCAHASVCNIHLQSHAACIPMHSGAAFGSVAILAQTMASSAKRRKTDEALVELHRGSYLSQRALSGVLKYVRDHGLPENISRSSQYRANENIIAKESNAYGSVLRCIDTYLENGTKFENWVCCPGPFLYSCCKSSAPLRELLRRSLQAHPCSLRTPWNIILYFDGISPRDPLAKGRDYRGVDAVYWSFAQFDDALANEDAWFTLSTARCAKIKNIPGGIGQSIKMVLKEVFF